MYHADQLLLKAALPPTVLPLLECREFAWGDWRSHFASDRAAVDGMFRLGENGPNFPFLLQDCDEDAPDSVWDGAVELDKDGKVRYHGSGGPGGTGGNRNREVYSNSVFSF